MESWLLRHYSFAEQHCCELARLSVAYKAQIAELQKQVSMIDLNSLKQKALDGMERGTSDEFDRRTTDGCAVDVAFAKNFLSEVNSGRSSPKVAPSVPPTLPTDDFWLGAAPETKLVLAPPKRCGFKLQDEEGWGEGEVGCFAVRKPSLICMKDGKEVEVEDEDIDSEDEMASEANEKYCQMDAARSTSSSLEDVKESRKSSVETGETAEPDSGDQRRRSMNSGESGYASKHTLLLREDWSSEERLSTVKSGKSVLTRSTKFSTVGEDREIKVLFTRGKSQMRILQGSTKYGFDAYVIPPTSLRRALLDILGMLMVAWDVITLPLFAFQFDDTSLAKVAGIVTTSFWTLDIALSFFRGYYDATDVERHFANTAKRYLRTWFAPDVVLVSVDWVVVLFGNSTAQTLRAARIAKAVRLLRMLRMVRLGRVVRFVTLVEDLTSSVFSEMAICVLSIAKLFLSLVVFNHLVACGWYATGKLSHSPDRISWVDAYSNQDMFRLYVIAFHWSIAQFTPAPHYVHPENHQERIYAVGVVLFGMLIFSSFLANMTSLVTQIRKVSVERSKQQELVRRFLSDHEIPRGLFTRITSFAARHHFFSQKNLTLEQDIAIFSELPEEVRMDLHAELNSPLLLRHPLFGTMAPVYSEFLFKACHYCINDTILKKDDYLFDIGDQAVAMYVLRTGSADYSWRKPVHSRSLDSTEKSVRESDWVSEVALWVQWAHVGRLTCRKPCVFMVVNAQEFGKQARRDVQAHNCLRTYAKFFVEKAAQADLMGLNNDIWGNAEERGSDCLREICQQSIDLWEGVMFDHGLQRQGVHLPFSEAIVQQLRGTTLLRRSADNV